MFKIVEKSKSTPKQTIVVCKDNKSVNQNGEVVLEILFDDLNLGVNIYGDSKRSSKDLQRQNCKKVVKIYKQVVKTVKKFKRRKVDICPQIVVENLGKKKNNNDLMLEYMLKVKFDTAFGKKLFATVDFACDWLDNENEVFKMCDFVDNKCAKARARGFERMTGCCPAKCKFMDNCPCKTKNISCKFIFCDYLEEKGFCINPLSLPIFVANLTFFQRVASWGLFFKSQKKVNFWLHFVNVLTIFVGVVFVLALLKICGVF